MASRSHVDFDGPVLVTGGRGFIGRRVVSRLARAGQDVVVTTVDGGGAPEGARLVEVDLRDRDAASRAFAGVRTVIHLAARSGGIQLQDEANIEIYVDNQEITRSVLAAAVGAGVSRVYLGSSGVVYRGESEGMLDESAALVDPAGPPSGYAFSKVADEVMGAWYQQTGALEVVAGRFTNIYGPGAPSDPARSTVIHSLILKALEASPGGVMRVWGDGSAVRSFLYVDDAAEAVITIAGSGSPGETYNIDSSEPISIAALAALIRDTVDTSVSLEFDPSEPTGVQYRVLNSDKLKGLGFRPQVDLPDGIARTVQGFRDRG